MVYTLRFFSLQSAVCFIILTYLVPVLFTVYIQGVLKLKKNNSSAKRLSKTVQCGLKLPEHDFTKLSFWFIVYFDHVPAEIRITVQPT